MLQESAQKSELLLLNGHVGDDNQSIIYKNIKVLGQYDTSHQFLLDNQVNHGKAGYFVLTPFRIKGANKAVLVNRGWLPLGKDRRILPEISLEDDEISVKGRANHFPSVGIKLQDAEIPGKGWPSLIQVVDTKVIAKIIGYELMPLQIELNPSERNGYIREWQNVAAMPPEKHTAYAVQWFLLALTLTLLFIKYGRQKNHE